MAKYKIDGDPVSKPWHTVLTEYRRRGGKFQLNDGRRTLAMQRARIRKYGRWSPSNPTGAAPAVPWAPHINYGRANHALDVDMFAVKPGAPARMQRWLRKHGVDATRPIAAEPWHIQVNRKDLLRFARSIERANR